MGLRSIGCIALLVGACGGGGSSDKPWAVAGQVQATALLSVWGSSSTDVWVVGGDRGDMTGPVVEHYDGTTWTKLNTQLANTDLWWVKGFDGGPVMIGGSNGTILSYANGQFTPMPTPAATGVVFGIWGATPNDVWAVGGNLGGLSGAFVWHYDGNTWTAQTLPPDLVANGTCWKVNGLASNDVWIVGTNGTTMHWDGTSLTTSIISSAQQQQDSIFSVAGNSKGYVAVGGAFDGVIYENNGSGWSDSKIPPGGALMSGVAVSETDAYAVGDAGNVLRRQNGHWSTEKMLVTDQHLHAVWIDPDGGVWAVGGQFDTHPMMNGVLIHKGDALQGSF